ncbi:hypothetical protein IWQ56_002553 [Coemansia nantahalensis]|nr:hypothetical protein IWQ56_002553 [Coemansia nantahalensis]
MDSGGSPAAGIAAGDAMDPAAARLLQVVKDAGALVEAEEAAAANQGADADCESGDADSSMTSGSDFDVDSDADEDGDAERNKSIRRMIADDDDEDGAGTAVLVTRHEVPEPAVPAPPITQIPETAQLCALGAVHSVVGSSVIVQAHISGEKHVLDSESLVAFADGRVLGLLCDVFGPVAQPMYTVRFNSAEEIDRERCAVGTPVFYALGWARMLATERLRAKGTDASNEYDEEVGSDAMEFSDDEAEQAFKRKKKRDRVLRAHAPTAATPADPRPPQPPPPPNAAPASAVAGRKLQTYDDICDPDLGF